MAAPITKLLFVFLLGITSWSHYVAANKVTVKECTTEVADGNEVMGSMDCSIEDNKLRSVINIKGCPGVPQLSMQLVKDGVVVTTGGKSIKDPKEEMGSFCNSVDGPDAGDDSCSMGEGDFELSGCDIEQYVSDNDPGNYEAKIEIQDDSASYAIVTVLFDIEG